MPPPQEATPDFPKATCLNPTYHFISYVALTSITHYHFYVFIYMFYFLSPHLNVLSLSARFLYALLTIVSIVPTRMTCHRRFTIKSSFLIEQIQMTPMINYIMHFIFLRAGNILSQRNLIFYMELRVLYFGWKSKRGVAADWLDWSDHVHCPGLLASCLHFSAWGSSVLMSWWLRLICQLWSP